MRLVRAPAHSVALGLALACASLAGAACRVEARTIPPVVTPSAGGAPWTAAERDALRARLDALFSSSVAIRGAHVGLYAIDTTSSTVLFARVPDDEFMPASTLKLLVGSVALARLGADFRFVTEAFVTRPVAGGVEPGTLVLRGGGDPFLRASDVAALAAAVAGQGIRSIPGGVAVDSSYFDGEPYPPGWAWDDFPYYYAPVVSATTFEKNVVHVAASAGARVGDPAAITTNVPDALRATPDGCVAGPAVVIVAQATTARAGTGSTLDVDRLPGGCIAVIGALPIGGSDTVDAAVPSPEAYVRDALVRALRERGVDVAQTQAGAAASSGDDRYRAAPGDTRSVVWTHDSEPLPTVLADMWYPSDNLVAELLLKSLGVTRAGVPGTTENGAKYEREWLRSIGVDLRTVTLSDGSGLSIYNRITPRDLVAVLQADWRGPNRQLVLAALPVAGVRGTLREEFVDTPAAGRAFVKTGSMSHVRGLAGYVQTRRHGAATFALMVDDWNGDRSALDDFRGAVLTALLGT